VRLNSFYAYSDIDLLKTSAFNYTIKITTCQDIDIQK